MATVDLKDVQKVYPGGVEAVKGVSIDIPDGSFACWSVRPAAASPRCCA